MRTRSTSYTRPSTRAGSTTRARRRSGSWRPLPMAATPNEGLRACDGTSFLSDIYICYDYCSITFLILFHFKASTAGDLCRAERGEGGRGCLLAGWMRRAEGRVTTEKRKHFHLQPTLNCTNFSSNPRISSPLPLETSPNCAGVRVYASILKCLLMKGQYTINVE